MCCFSWQANKFSCSSFGGTAACRSLTRLQEQQATFAHKPLTCCSVAIQDIKSNGLTVLVYFFDSG